MFIVQLCVFFPDHLDRTSEKIKPQRIAPLRRKIGLGKNKGHLFIYLALTKPALPGQFVLLVSSQSKEKS
jgi:hypothetical protein